MGKVRRLRSADAGADALAHDRGATGPDRHPHLGGIEAGGLAALQLGPQAARRQRGAVPAVVAEDPVGLGDDVPALDIGDRRAVAGPGLDMAIAELGLQRLALLVGERHHLVLTVSCGFGATRTAPSMAVPVLSAARIPSLSSLAGCGFQ